MYLKSLTLSHMKRVEHLHLDFLEADGSPRMWTVLIGENGTAKTTILQAIALTAAGRMWVNDLARPVMGGFARAGGKGPPMTIEARYTFSKLERQKQLHTGAVNLPPETTLYSRVTLDPNETTLQAFDRYEPGDASESVALTPLERSRAEGRAHWFVAAYGVNRGLPSGEAPDLSRPAIDRLRPFFSPRLALTSIDFIDMFGPKSDKGKRYTRALNDILIGTGLLPEDIVGVELRGRSGARRPADIPFRNQFIQKVGGREVKVPMNGAAHGMQSTLAWIADLVGHVMFETSARVEAADLEGLILLDEIDLYLHPLWQRRIVSALRKVFPLLQFVVTTHSPVMLSAFEPHEVVRLGLDGRSGSVTMLPHTSDPRLLTETELLEDYFHFDDATPNPNGEQLREATSLANQPERSDFEEQRLVTLLDELKAAGEDIGDLRTRKAEVAPHLQELDAWFEELEAQGPEDGGG